VLNAHQWPLARHKEKNEGFVLNLYSCSPFIHGVAAQLAKATNCGIYDWGPVPNWSVGTLIFSAKSRMTLTVQYRGCVMLDLEVLSDLLHIAAAQKFQGIQ